MSVLAQTAAVRPQPMRSAEVTESVEIPQAYRIAPDPAPAWELAPVRYAGAAW